MANSADDLKRAIESQHGGTATLGGEVTVRESWQGKTAWEGVVSVFDLVGHPKAKRAYAWSHPVEGSTKRRFFAVLHIPPVDSPAAAVRAAIVAENRKPAIQLPKHESPAATRFLANLPDKGERE